jgi:hypothetical protein
MPEVPTSVMGTKRSILAPKLAYLADLPYDITIYVDCDTKFYADPSILAPETPWDFDLAICKESICGAQREPTFNPCGNWLNTGFMVINDGKSYQELIKRAQAKHLTLPRADDQWAINHAYGELFEITVKILPQKWNVRDPIMKFFDDPCMVHSRGIL